MNLTLDRIFEIFPYFNDRPITENDFWRACKREKVIVKEMPLMVNGYYQFKRGRHYILLNNRLSGLTWLHTAFHEFCHYLFDAPMPGEEQTLYRRPCGDRDDPRDMFADAFALICLLPFPELVRLAMEEDLSSNEQMLNLAMSRVEVRAKYGI